MSSVARSWVMCLLLNLTPKTSIADCYSTLSLFIYSSATVSNTSLLCCIDHISPCTMWCTPQLNACSVAGFALCCSIGQCHSYCTASVNVKCVHNVGAQNARTHAVCNTFSSCHLVVWYFSLTSLYLCSWWKCMHKMRVMEWSRRNVGLQYCFKMCTPFLNLL